MEHSAATRTLFTLPYMGRAGEGPSVAPCSAPLAPARPYAAASVPRRVRDSTQ